MPVLQDALPFFDLTKLAILLKLMDQGSADKERLRKVLLASEQQNNFLAKDQSRADTSLFIYLGRED